MDVVVTLTDEQIDAIAQRAAAICAHTQTSSTPTWLNTADAADYIAAKPGRVHDLVQLGKLQPRRDGRRLLFRRSDLDDYLEADR
jgi:excisionase family DNA binding protein